MKRLILILLAAIMALSLAACQETPEEVIVVKKDAERMIESAESNEQGFTYSQLELPETSSFSYAAKDGRFTVEGDAFLQAPDTGAISAYTVKKGVFTQDMADRLMAVLLKGSTLYERQLSDGAIASLEEKLAILKKEKADGTDAAQYADGHNIDTAIAELEARIAGAKDRGERIPASTTFKRDGEFGYEYIEGTATVDGRECFFEIKNWTEGESQIYACLLADGIGSLSVYTYDPSVSVGVDKEAAVSQADAVVEALGLNDMAAVVCEKAKNGDKTAWHIIYTRNYDGVDTTYTTKSGDEAAEGSAYSVPWGYEQLQMLIDERGILGFKWENPYADVEKTIEDCRLIPFEQVMGIFEKMIAVDNAVFSDSFIDISVDRIKLGMMRVRSQDDNEKGMVVPVWDFFGSYAQAVDRDSAMPMNQKYDSFLTINAIDGTIIDRSLGY